MDKQHAALVRDVELFRMKKMHAYIAIRGTANASESSDVAPDRMALYARTFRPVQDYRVNKTRWVVLRWPSPSMAQGANMSTEAFENLFFKVCTMDYRKLERAMTPLQKRMQRAKSVHLKGPGTDLKFSLKGMPAILCKGDRNIPDGEVFSCPVKDSVEGQITYNAPSLYSGTKFENVHLEFKQGKIVKAAASNTKRLNEILDTDSKARGNQSANFRWERTRTSSIPCATFYSTKKIAGSLHFTPGQAYENCDNGNRSAGALGPGAHPAQRMGRRRGMGSTTN